MFRIFLLLLVLISGVMAADAPPWTGDFRNFARAEIEKWKVPGVAVGMVLDGELVFAEGFGYRNLEKKLPVDSDTLFAIGSCTKAFTATAVGILVDRGQLSWQDRVVHHLPDFRLKDDLATLRMTPEDLLCHRSGLGRHDLIWYLTDFSREDLIRRFRHLEPSQDFRTRFQYNNLMYMTAGHLVGVTAGTGWEDFMRQNLFAPLGMKHTNLSVTAMQQDPNHASGYDLDKDKNVIWLPHKNIDIIGPAGSINSSVTEMSHWMIMNLNQGKYGDQQIITAQNLAHIQRPHIFAAPARHQELTDSIYGLGWDVATYRGEPFLAHNGGIDGFISRVLLLPDQKAGVAILTNQSDGGYQTTLTMSYRFIDLLPKKEAIDWSGRLTARAEEAKKGEEPPEKPVPGTRPSHALTDYAGLYRDPGYGDIAVHVVDQRLKLTYFQYTTPLEHWHFDTFSTTTSPIDDTKIHFTTNGKGEIGKLSLILDPSVEAVVFERVPHGRD